MVISDVGRMKVVKIQRVYQVWGLLEKVTSRGTGTPGTIRNEVKFEFDHFGQLAKDWQEHNGQVTGSTKVVGYLHATGAGNTVRLTGLVYLDGTTQWGYVYASGVADAMSRVSSLTLGGSPIVTYRYLGLSARWG